MSGLARRYWASLTDADAESLDQLVEQGRRTDGRLWRRYLASLLDLPETGEVVREPKQGGANTTVLTRPYEPEAAVVVGVSPPARRHRWRASGFTVGVLLIAAAAFAASRFVAPVLVAPPTIQPVAPAAEPLLVTSKWPTLKGCDGSTAVAMPSDGKPLTHFTAQAQDFRTVVTAPKNKGGTWGAGHLYVDLSAKGDTAVTVDKIHLSAVPERINAPAWVALTQGGCGDTQDRVFELDLDKTRLVDRGVQGLWQPGDKPAPTNPLGSGFTVSAKDPAIVRVDATACHGNYQWSLVIDYSYNGKQLKRTLGPFKTFSLPNSGTQAYVPDPSTGDIGEPLQKVGIPSGCPATS